MTFEDTYGFAFALAVLVTVDKAEFHAETFQRSQGYAGGEALEEEGVF